MIRENEAEGKVKKIYDEIMGETVNFRDAPKIITFVAVRRRNL